MPGIHPNKIVVNERPYHLYIIYDHQYKRIFKFGVSSGHLRKNGGSPRLNRQLSLHNKPEDFVRFTGRVLEVDIKGLIRAYIREDDMMDLFRSKNNDQLPKGNEGHLYLGRKYAYLLVESDEQ